MNLYLAIQRHYGETVVTWGSRDQLRLKTNAELEYFFDSAQLGDWLSLGGEDVIIRVKREEMEG